jgi:hypothetical protein
MQLAYHPRLGALVMTRSSVYANASSDFGLRDWRQVLDPEKRMGNQEGIFAIAPFEDGVLIGDGFGRIFWSPGPPGDATAASASSERRFDDVLARPAYIVPLRQGFAVIAKDVYVPLRPTQPTNLLITFATRRECFDLPDD